MSTNIVSLNSLDDKDPEYMRFIDDLREDNGNAIFLIEKNNGEVYVGCNFDSRKDLVYAMYRLQGLAQTIVNGEQE